MKSNVSKESSVSQSHSNNRVTNHRNERITSHALVEVRSFKWLPFSIQSAVLLDISVEGFKLEFTGEFKAKEGDTYWLHIPLPPLGIFSPQKLLCRVQVRWFDNKRYRIGGIFLSLSQTERMIITQILESLKRKGAGQA